MNQTQGISSNVNLFSDKENPSYSMLRSYNKLGAYLTLKTAGVTLMGGC
jgi:hypothetical protein